MAAAPTANPPLGSLVLTMGLIVVVMSGCVSPWKQTLPGTTPAPHYQEVPSNSPAPADNGSTSPTYQYRPYPVPDQLPDSTAPKIKTDRPYDGRDDETDRSVPLEELPASPKEGPENRDTPGWKPRVPDSSKVPDPIDVVVECEFDSTLAFPGKDGTRVRRAVGTLAAGETKKVVLSLSSGMVGRHCCRFSVMSGGIEVVWKSVCVEFVERNFDVEILGPTARTVGSRAEFVVKIVNRSKQELKDVNLVLRHDPQLVPREATEGACFIAGGI
jgi:hypothetical protein